MEKIIINGKEVELKPITFKSFKDLEKLGFTISCLTNPEEHYWATMSALTAYNMGVSLEEADKQIEEHLENGGDIQFGVKMVEAVSKSDFFQKMVNSRKK